MAFPNNPSNGDTFVRYGRTYEYEAALSMWKVKQSGIQLTELSDIDITTTPPVAGDALVWSGTKFEPDNINLLSVYQSELPLSGNVSGQMAYVTDTSRLYIYTGAGWFNVALVNTNPTITVGPDGSYVFATDGTPIVLTLEAQDPEEVPITWSYAVTSGSLGNTATVSQADNVFTITPSTDPIDTGGFSITFTASDGVNLATAVSSFTLLFSVADQYYNNNSILLKSGSTAGLNNTTFVDESTNGFTVTPTGDVHQGSLSPYSPAGWSAYFDGTNDTITVSGAQTVSGTFTFECWIKTTKPATHIMTKYPGSGSNIDMFGTDFSGRLMSAWPKGTADITSTTNVCDGQWHHVAFSRNGNTYILFVDGVIESVENNTENGEQTVTPWVIGQHGQYAAYNYQGYISDLRFVLGTAVYTSNFTPPTEPLTAIPGTVILTCQSNRFIDNSPNNFSLTPSGTMLSAVSPYLPSEKYDPTVHGGSAYFDGSGDYLSVADNASLEVGSGDFTLEGWFYGTAAGGTDNIIVAKCSASYAPYWVSFFGGNSIKFCASSTNSSWDVANNVSFGSPTLNSWNHFAVSRSGTAIRLFLNGVLGATVTTSAALTDHASPFTVGSQFNGANLFTGYISNIRLVKGTAVYTSNFTPPTQSLTAISGTSLLLNMSNAGIYDETAKNNIKVIGNTTTSTTQTKYNDTAMYFDGTGDYLIMDVLTGQFGTGDFTIEYWDYHGSQSTNYSSQVGTLSSGTPAGTWRFGTFTNNAGVTFAYHNGSAYVDVHFGSVLYNDSAWRHFALTRQNGTVRAFVNGVQVGSNQTVTQNFNSSNKVIVGAELVNPTYFNGYIEDLRITNGVARYTTGFTPPTAPLGFNNEE